MKIKLEFDEVNSKEENNMSNFIVGVVDSIINEDKIKTCIRMIYNIYEDKEDEINCTNRKKFQDIIKLLIMLDDKEKE